MWLSFFLSAMLALTAVGPSYGESNLTFFGAPRAFLDGVLPVLSIEEGYIRSQTDAISNKAFGAAEALQCSASSPCPDGSCCNAHGQCGFRDEHCKTSCVADCDAKAPCGVNSKDGSQTCPLNVCCSYFGFCGATDTFCRDSTAAGQSTPCQKQFGKCGTVTPPTCGKSSGTASRRIAYYEGWNTRRRPCDKVWPENIDTTGLTHLIFSFATIDPTTFAVNPMHPYDEKLYSDFLALKDGSNKWIGIGGWEFSDAGATRHTWSQMASTKTNRDSFVVSLLKFLEKWDFAGVDIDWEWPGAETRGGNPAIDMRNQIELMVELRKSLGSRGLSVVLPAQYEYLKYLDPKALEAQVDFFNLLAYDLHGPWDAAIPGEGATVKPHTDLKEIDTALNLFWFNGVQPSKINLGVANYGRGYTVADTNCAKYGCAWTGPSKAGECTQLEGVLSQCEIQRIISSKRLSPEIIAGGAGVKQVIFDGQWVGYDDTETLGLKTELANNRCLGGTALWAIDYASCGRGGGGPGSPQLSSAVPSPSAPDISVAPPSLVPSKPAASSVSAASSAPAASPAPSSVFTSSKMPSTSPSTRPSNDASSVPATASSTTSQAGPVSPTSVFQSSQVASSSSMPTSSATSGSSHVFSSVTSQPASSGVPPVLTVPSLGSSQSPQISGTSTTTTTTTAAVSSAALSSNVATSPDVSAGPSSSSTSVSVSSASISSAASLSQSRDKTSSTASRGTSSAHLSSVGATPDASWVSSQSASSSTVGLSNVPSGSDRTSGTETASGIVSTLFPPQSLDLISSQAATSSGSQAASNTDIVLPPFSTPIVSGTQSQASTTNNGDASTLIIPVPAFSTSTNSDGLTFVFPVPPAFTTTDGGNGPSFIFPPPLTTADDGKPGTTLTPIPFPPSFQWSDDGKPHSTLTLLPAPFSSLTWSDDGKPHPTSMPVPEFPSWFSTTDDGKPHPTLTPVPPPTGTLPHQTDSGTSTKPGSTTKPDTDYSGTNVSPPTGTTSHGAHPTPTGALMKGCVPNNCIADCIPWYVITLIAFKRPYCPCKVLTCKRDDDEDEWSDSDSDGKNDLESDSESDTDDDHTHHHHHHHHNSKGKKKCKLFGCGCGWMGINFGPGCDSKINIPLPNLFPAGVFGPEPCKLFGGCIPGPPPGSPDCGPFGCGGYCNTPGGCEPCPPEICGGPQCTIPTGCGPKPGPNPTPDPSRPTKCGEDQKTTVTEKIVHCTENLKLEPTTIQSINFTLTSTVTSTCLTPVLRTLTGCGILGTTTTTTHSSYTTTSSDAPACSRAPLDLNNDEGDNEQPPRTTDGPTCTRDPLSLDDDEGDNEKPTSSEAPSCTRAPLSLDDDEGNNEMPADMSSSLSMSFLPTPSANSSSLSLMPTTSHNSSIALSTSSSRVPPPSTLSMSTTPPWGTGIPTGTPTLGNCFACNEFFTNCVRRVCKQDGSDAESCAKWCLSALCYASDSVDYCKKGLCRPAACPKENPKDFEKGQPAIAFTTVLTLSTATITVTATPGPASATPTCKSGGTISPTGKWTVYLEHEVKEKPLNTSLTWTLWDENGCEANKGSASNLVKHSNLTVEIGASSNRPQNQKMGYMLHTNVTDSASTASSEIEFVISKPPAGCSQICWVKWKIAESYESKSWQLTDDCARQCGSRKLETSDISCDDGINKFQDYGNGVQKRAGYCTWRKPFEPADDNPPPPPPPFGPFSLWHLELRQQMEYKKSEIEWNLYDPNKNHAGHGFEDTSGSDNFTTIVDTQGREGHPQDQMQYKMELTVTKPRNKDKSTVSIQYTNVGQVPGCVYGDDNFPWLERTCNPAYTTEPNDEKDQAYLWNCEKFGKYTYNICPKPLVDNKHFSCDPVGGIFYPKNAGFERKFSCWWPHGFPIMPGQPGYKGEVGGMDIGDINETTQGLGINGGVNGSRMNGA